MQLFEKASAKKGAPTRDNRRWRRRLRRIRYPRDDLLGEQGLKNGSVVAKKRFLPFARPAVADRNTRAVRFAMKDGSQTVDILVSNPALESIDIRADRTRRLLRDID